MIQIRLEEYTGGKRSERVILKHSVRAAELSGKDLLLTHQPEKWTGPQKGISGAVATAIQENGMVKPVLVFGDKQWKAGAPFRLRPPARSE